MAEFTADRLISLGNTCYMNATVQALRAVPELQLALSAYVNSFDLEYPAYPALCFQLRYTERIPIAECARWLVQDYVQYNRECESERFPSDFTRGTQSNKWSWKYSQLQRQVNPQFAERDRSGRGINSPYAQQGMSTTPNSIIVCWNMCR